MYSIHFKTYIFQKIVGPVAMFSVCNLHVYQWITFAVDTSNKFASYSSRNMVWMGPRRQNLRCSALQSMERTWFLRILHSASLKSPNQCNQVKVFWTMTTWLPLKHWINANLQVNIDEIGMHQLLHVFQVRGIRVHIRYFQIIFTAEEL